MEGVSRERVWGKKKRKNQEVDPIGELTLLSGRWTWMAS